MTEKTSIAIIGAGLAGLTAAHHLSKNFDVKVFDKARGPAGRMATRYDGDYEFDHGVQSFTARSAEFKSFLTPYIKNGTVQNWPDNKRYVAAPRMNALGKAIAADLDVTLGCKIADVSRKDSKWQLTNDEWRSEGRFDWVIFATPRQQALALLPDSFAQMNLVDSAKMLPAFTLMAGLDRVWPFEWTNRQFDGGPILEVSVNNVKPGRPEVRNKTSLVIQADNHWASTMVNVDKKRVLAELIADFKTRCGLDISGAAHLDIHRWLYANVSVSAGEAYLIDAPKRLAVCGDWCIGGRVEAAFLSGHALATQILEMG